VNHTALQLDASYLVFLLEGSRAFVNPKELLEDLSPESAVKVVEGCNHTIAKIVAHLLYWQNWFYQGATSKLQVYPHSNELSFPKVAASEWESLRANFLQSLGDIKKLCADTALLNRAFSQGETLEGGHDQRTVAMTLLYTVALHNAHHYGQIITLRQVLGSWPPKAGGVSW
jgi:uncharacterized damage-inducible protein DinB